MTSLQLAPEELNALDETLARSIRDLAEEMSHTDSREFKDRLKQRKTVLERLLTKVQGIAVPA